MVLKPIAPLTVLVISGSAIQSKKFDGPAILNFLQLGNRIPDCVGINNQHKHYHQGSENTENDLNPVSSG